MIGTDCLPRATCAVRSCSVLFSQKVKLGPVAPLVSVRLVHARIGPPSGTSADWWCGVVHEPLRVVVRLRHRSNRVFNKSISLKESWTSKTWKRWLKGGIIDIQTEVRFRPAPVNGTRDYARSVLSLVLLSACLGNDDTSHSSRMRWWKLQGHRQPHHGAMWQDRRDILKEDRDVCWGVYGPWEIARGEMKLDASILKRWSWSWATISLSSEEAATEENHNGFYKKIPSYTEQEQSGENDIQLHSGKFDVKATTAISMSRATRTSLQGRDSIDGATSESDNNLCWEHDFRHPINFFCTVTKDNEDKLFWWNLFRNLDCIAEATPTQRLQQRMGLVMETFFLCRRTVVRVSFHRSAFWVRFVWMLSMAENMMVYLVQQLHTWRWWLDCTIVRGLL